MEQKKTTINNGADFASFLETLRQLEKAERGDGIVTLVRKTVSISDSDASALDKAENGFEYMKNVREYRKNITLFGISGFLDIGVENGKISSVSFFMAEHAEKYNQGEMTLVENAVKAFGSPDSINFHGEPQTDFGKIKAAFMAEDEYGDIVYDSKWDNIAGAGYSFLLYKEFAMFKNRNLSHYIFSR